MQTSRRPLLLMEIPAHSSSPGLNQETAHLRAVSLVPGLSLKGSSMKKSSAWKMVCIVFMFCAASVIAAPAQTLTTLYSFCPQQYCPDGEYPLGRLVQATDGNFYGTTFSGGASNLGTAFKITAGGSLTILHSFTGPSDGGNPQGGLVQGSDGNLYGTAVGGGTNGEGTVFKITTSGTLTTLHSFAITDGAAPSGTLVQASDGNFYGTTYEGGTSNNGTVFKMIPSGTLTTLYNFCSQLSCADGRIPYAGLVQASDGNFYGTTYQGGGAADYGTVFAITPSGTLTTLHVFTGADGANPYAGLIQTANGTFYGVTKDGGSNCTGNGGCGTVFKLQLPPTLTVSTSGDGSVASTDGFIHCPGTCSHTYPLNTPVTLNATPGQGWVFGGWDGACLGTGACSVTMTQPLSVDGIFSQAQQFVAVTPCRFWAS